MCVTRFCRGITSDETERLKPLPKGIANMLLTLIRDTFTSTETLGKLYINRQCICDTIEPPVTPNTSHPKGCIPQGWYRLSVTHSPRFDRLLPILHMVPSFEGIRIHAGNHREHTAGCILVGKLLPLSRDRALSEQLYIPTLTSSRHTEQQITHILLQAQHEKENIYIDITSIDTYPSERSALDSM